MIIKSAMWRGNFTKNWQILLRDRWRNFCRPPGSKRRSPEWATSSATQLFPPLVILWAWIGQTLDKDKACNKAVARVNAHRVSLGLEPVSSDTGGYTKARRRPPEGFFKRLFLRLAITLSEKAREEDLWKGRKVKVVDGSSSQMPDTPANQKVYPQPTTQKPGCGFPVVAFVGVFCLATGAALALALGKWSVHDLSLFYFLRDVFVTGDIMLADRGFCSYAELALMKKRGVDSLMRMHQARSNDFRRGRAIGLLDRIVTWAKPVSCPRGLQKKDYRRLPATLTLRKLRFRIETKGFRTQEVTLVTTLLDPELYSADELATLYFRRWDVELDFRHIKTTMGMDVLRGKSPGVVRREIWVHLVAYNLIRAVMWEAALEAGVSAERISFNGTIQHVSAHSDLFPARPPSEKGIALRVLLCLVGSQVVPHRPGRVEPRARKRRPKSYPLMTQPRAQLRAVLRA